MMDRDKVRGALLGTAVGDALGMPVEGLSHQNVRTYYKGIKGYRADEHPDLARRITESEFLDAIAQAHRHGLTRLDDRAMVRRLTGGR